VESAANFRRTSVSGAARPCHGGKPSQIPRMDPNLVRSTMMKERSYITSVQQSPEVTKYFSILCDRSIAISVEVAGYQLTQRGVRRRCLRSPR
jgi:hypothetical protein